MKKTAFYSVFLSWYAFAANGRVDKNKSVCIIVRVYRQKEMGWCRILIGCASAGGLRMDFIFDGITVHAHGLTQYTSA